MQQLTRREILETLKRQGIQGLSRIKAETKQFERYWERRMTFLAWEKEASQCSSGYAANRGRALPLMTIERSDMDA